MRTKLILFLLLIGSLVSVKSQNKSNFWVADLGNGKYRNPILYSDFSDPDACKAGDTYYMVASSFNCVPGLPILESKDLVNWKMTTYALGRQVPEDVFDKPQHGNGVWAPSIRFHNNEFYIYYPDPDYGFYRITSKSASGPWSEPLLVKKGKGLIDCCPFWDNNGEMYLSYALAGSRAGNKSVILVAKMNEDGTKMVGDGRIVFDGHQGNETIEGSKMYKRNGFYYIFAPAGGVVPGWQEVLRSKSPFGPYENRTVMHQGSSKINGPHQGAWVTTDTGEDWFLNFQDVGTVGRIVHLNPMKWVNDWPVIGVDKNNTGCGEPVSEYAKPNVGKSYPIETPVVSDEFNSTELGLQWQWQANPVAYWYFCNALNGGWLRLYSYKVPDHYKSLWDVPNLLLQKVPAPEFTATAKIRFEPDSRYFGERCGLVLMGLDYALLSLENTDKGIVLSQNNCLKADKGGTEEVKASVLLSQKELYLRISFTEGKNVRFSYSLDGRKFLDLGGMFPAREGKWIGAKMGFFCTRQNVINDGGWLDIDWFRVEK
ncbi:MAG TPA: glycoside hydrolase 43 family protein [Bacteroidales bacterium]|nr:glycoside hydrolase 43 family protein [Bacteroidales bacterium]